MKTLFDFFPIIVFFVLYKMGNIQVATVGVIVATGLQVLIRWLVSRAVERSYWISFLAVLVLGGLTLAFNDARFLQWKPTVVYWVMALGFLLSHFVAGKKSVMERVLEGKVDLPVRILRGMNLSWVVFFILIGALNLYVAWSFSLDTWVNFKMFGLLGITVAFTVLQGLVIWRLTKDGGNPGALSGSGKSE